MSLIPDVNTKAHITLKLGGNASYIDSNKIAFNCACSMDTLLRPGQASQCFPFYNTPL